MPLSIRLTDIDSKLPNMALMRLATYHRRRGDTVHFMRSPTRQLGEPEYDRVYASALFALSKPKIEQLKASFPDAIVGGSRWVSALRLEDVAPGIEFVRQLDYSLYPEFQASIGRTQTGCRLSCGFCEVPWVEGRPRPASTIAEIWRGPGHKKWLHILDGDFFGWKGWERTLDDINTGGFRVAFSQGINIRLVNRRIAEALAATKIRSYDFSRRRLYASWDNLKDRGVVFRGLDYLADAGIPGRAVLCYMLVGWDPSETWPRIFERFEALKRRGVMPYPMPYFPGWDATPEQMAHFKRLRQFQRWVVTGIHNHTPDFADYKPGFKRSRAASSSQLPLFDDENAA